MHEIERKFIVRKEATTHLTPLSILTIMQGYIKNDVGEIRVRRTVAPDKSTAYELGTKEEVRHGVREEIECDITQDMFYALYKVCDKVKKIRWILLNSGLTFHVDFYGKEHGDLIVAEIEFDTEKEMEEFEPLLYEFLEEEVTGDPAYKNVNLARKNGRRSTS